MPAVSLNVPHYKQEFNYSCVPACVRMVLAHFGKLHGEAEMRQVLGAAPHGTRMRNILRLASLGLDVQLGTMSLAQITTALGAGVPPLVFLETSYLDYWSIRCDHVAVVVGLDAALVLLNDPFFDTAPQRTSLTGFLQAWAVNEQYTALIRPRP